MNHFHYKGTSFLLILLFISTFYNNLYATGFGNGNDGNFPPSPGVGVHYMDDVRAAVYFIDVGQNKLFINNISNPFNQGDRILLIQMVGETPDYNNPGADKQTGIFEFLDVNSVGSFGTELTVSNPNNVLNRFSTISDVPGHRVQVIRINRYDNVELNGNDVMTCNAWDGNTGGVLVFFAQNDIIINSLNAKIDVSGKGYFNDNSGGAGGVGGAGGTSSDNWGPIGTSMGQVICPQNEWRSGHSGKIGGSPVPGQDGNPGIGATNYGKSIAETNLLMGTAGSGGDGGKGGDGGANCGVNCNEAFTTGENGGIGGNGGDGGSGSRGGGAMLIKVRNIVSNVSLGSAVLFSANGENGEIGGDGTGIGGTGGNGGNGANGCDCSIEEDDDCGAGGGGGKGARGDGADGGEGGGGGNHGTIWVYVTYSLNLLQVDVDQFSFLGGNGGLFGSATGFVGTPGNNGSMGNEADICEECPEITYFIEKCDCNMAFTYLAKTNEAVELETGSKYLFTSSDNDETGSYNVGYYSTYIKTVNTTLLISSFIEEIEPDVYESRSYYCNLFNIDPCHEFLDAIYDYIKNDGCDPGDCAEIIDEEYIKFGDEYKYYFSEGSTSGKLKKENDNRICFHICKPHSTSGGIIPCEDYDCPKWGTDGESGPDGETGDNTHPIDVDPINLDPEDRETKGHFIMRQATGHLKRALDIENIEYESFDYINIKPNPAFNTIYIDVFENINTPVNIIISDMSGRIVLSKVFNSSLGMNHFELDISELKPANYILEYKGSQSGKINLLIK